MLETKRTSPRKPHSPTRRARNPLSSQQSHRLQQLDYRLQIVAEGQGSAATVRSEAIETLQVFGWSVPDLGF